MASPACNDQGDQGDQGERTEGHSSFYIHGAAWAMGMELVFGLELYNIMGARMEQEAHFFLCKRRIALDTCSNTQLDSVNHCKMV